MIAWWLICVSHCKSLWTKAPAKWLKFIVNLNFELLPCKDSLCNVICYQFKQNLTFTGNYLFSINRNYWLLLPCNTAHILFCVYEYLKSIMTSLKWFPMVTDVFLEFVNLNITLSAGCFSVLVMVSSLITTGQSRVWSQWGITVRFKIARLISTLGWMCLLEGKWWAECLKQKRYLICSSCTCLNNVKD